METSYSELMRVRDETDGVPIFFSTSWILLKSPIRARRDEEMGRTMAHG
jgi:hypothetical protein